MSFPALKNPPIREAIFDIRVKSDDDILLENLANFQSIVSEDFPNREIIVNLESELAIVDSRIPEALKLEQSRDGFLFRNDENSKIIQTRLDGFSFSLIGCYRSWDNFFEQAFQLWLKYREVANPSKIERLSLRFINSFQIPFVREESVKIEDYLNVYPEMGSNPDFLILQSLLRVVAKNDKFLPSLGIITEVLSPTHGEDDEDSLKVLLDIDVFQMVNILANEEELIKKTFSENLRIFKNEIFFDALTERTLEVLNG